MVVEDGIIGSLDSLWCWFVCSMNFVLLIEDVYAIASKKFVLLVVSGYLGC